MSQATARPSSDAGNDAWRALRDGMRRTRVALSGGLSDLLLGRRELPPDLLEQIETRLLQADAGVEVTAAVIAELTAALDRGQLADWTALRRALADILVRLLERVAVPPAFDADAPRPAVILAIGVNGAGKTTTIGKLGRHLQRRGRRVMLAAGDTFRAAAVEQIRTWGERIDAPVVAQRAGADAAAVIYDALGAARARGIDVLIADTAGRLHTRHNLMDELRKIRRTVAKFDSALPVETLLVIDAGTGRNALAQCGEFHAAIGVTGLALTKLDGTARGGVLLALARQYRIPVRYLGAGEGVDDLHEFDAAAFATALLDDTP